MDAARSEELLQLPSPKNAVSSRLIITTPTRRCRSSKPSFDFRRDILWNIQATAVIGKTISRPNSILDHEDRVTDYRFQYPDSDAALDCYSPEAATVASASPSTDTLPDDDGQQDQHERYPHTVASVVRLHDLANHKIYNT